MDDASSCNSIIMGDQPQLIHADSSGEGLRLDDLLGIRGTRKSLQNLCRDSPKQQKQSDVIA